MLSLLGLKIGLAAKASILRACRLAAAALGFLAIAGVTGGSGATSYNVRDSGMAVTLALPNAASTTVTSTGLDTGIGTNQAVNPGNVEFLLTAPAVTTTMAPDTRTFTYSIVVADDAALSTNATVLEPNVIVQTGAGGAGAAKATYRFRLPGQTQRYVGFKIVSGASTTDASSVSATLEALF